MNLKKICFNASVLFSVLVIPNQNAFAQATSNINVVCAWDSYDTNVESFVINISKNSVYWANQDKPLTLIKLNDGIVLFEGTRNRASVGEGKFISNIKLRFTINRISSEFKVEWLSPEYTTSKLGNYKDGEIYTRGCQVKKLF